MGRLLVYWSPAVVTASTIAFLSHQPSLPPLTGSYFDEILHFLAYGFLTLTLVYATTRGFEEALCSPARLAASILMASLYGITDEWHQSFIPGRDPAFTDWLADTAGAVVMAALLFARWRRMAAPGGRV